MIGVLVVTHGEFGAYMAEAAEEIVGPQKEGVRCISISQRLTLPEVRERLERAIAEMRAARGVLILTDMPGGTPCNIAVPLIKEREDVCVLCGVNLYMLVTAFNYRGTASLEELAAKVLDAGRRTIVDMGALVLSKCP